MHIIRNIILILLVLIWTNCKQNENKDNNDHLVNSIDTSKHIVLDGVFKATLPCADCAGIITKIYFQKDYTFIKEENYMIQSDTLPHVFYDFGKWSMRDSIITLHGQLSDTFSFDYLSDSSLQLIAQDGNKIPDSLSSQYQFTSQGKYFKSLSSFPISGVIDLNGDHPSLYVCNMEKTFLLQMNDKTKQQLDALWKLKKNPQDNKSIIQAESMYDSKSENSLTIIKVNHIIDGKDCK